MKQSVSHKSAGALLLIIYVLILKADTTIEMKALTVCVEPHLY